MPVKRRAHCKWLPDSNAAERAPNRSCTPRYSPLGFCASSCGTFRQLSSVCDDNEVPSVKIPFLFNALGSERKCRGADRKSVVWGKSTSVRVDHGGRRTIKKKNRKEKMT